MFEVEFHWWDNNLPAHHSYYFATQPTKARLVEIIKSEREKHLRTAFNPSRWCDKLEMFLRYLSKVEELPQLTETTILTGGPDFTISRITVHP